MLTTNNTALINSTGLIEDDLNRKKFNDLWSYLCLILVIYSFPISSWHTIINEHEIN